jgi:hypothetical protein
MCGKHDKDKDSGEESRGDEGREDAKALSQPGGDYSTDRIETVEDYELKGSRVSDNI